MKVSNVNEVYVNEKYKYLGKNTLLFTISSFGTKILSFFLIPLYTNVLTTAEYGTADLIATTATLLIFILTLNISDSVLRYALDIHNGVPNSKIVQSGIIARNRAGQDAGDDSAQRDLDQEAVLSYGNRVIILGTLICVLGLGVIAFLGLVDWPLHYFFYIVLYFFASAFYQMMSNYLRAIDKVAAVAVAGVLSSLITIICNIVFLLIIRLGIDGYILSMVIGPIISAVYCMLVAGAPVKTYFISSCSKAMEGEMRKYCIPLIFNNIALWSNMFIDRYFVTLICGIDANGIYSVATKIPVILATCYTVFGQAWNLSAIKEFDPEDSDGFFSKTYEGINALICSICSLLILLNLPLAHILYAKDFFGAWQYSSVLLVYVLFDSFAMLVAGVFSAMKKTNIIATSTVISSICNMALNFTLIPVCGPLGAAIATDIAYFVMWAIRMIYVKKYIRLRLHLGYDCCVYGIIILQIVFEHLPGHVYVGQSACFLLILVFSRKELKAMIGPMKTLLHGYIKRRN
jgi:O-antigen/teichoic acid export membrane protein